MRSIKGCIELTNLIINEHSQDSGIGELSDQHLILLVPKSEHARL